MRRDFGWLSQQREFNDECLSVSEWQRCEAIRAILGKVEAYKPEVRDLALRASEAILRDIEAKEAELLAECTTGLEKALVRQVMDAQTVLMASSEAYMRTVFGGPHEGPTGEYLDRLVDGAQKRYLRAVESLARVRRLLKLPMIVNVSTGLQQVNIGGEHGK